MSETARRCCQPVPLARGRRAGAACQCLAELRAETRSLIHSVSPGRDAGERRVRAKGFKAAGRWVYGVDAV